MKADEKEEMTIIDKKVLDDINDNKFQQKKFSSSSNNKKVPDTIVIDLQKQTIKVPEVEPVEPDSVFHHNVSIDKFLL